MPLFIIIDYANVAKWYSPTLPKWYSRVRSPPFAPIKESNIKNKEKEDAIKLRKKGLSIIDIAKKVGVSKGSVSLWVRDVNLTVDQENSLSHNMTAHHKLASSANINKAIEKRRLYQEEGRKDARKNDLKHAMGCMLYWAEGTKKNNKHVMKFSNSDPNMNKFFVSYLKKFYSLEDEDITLYLNFYTDLATCNEIETFWLKILNLPNSCLRKSTINNYSIYSKKKRCGLSKYGTCVIVVNKTTIIQRIYGSIQEYMGFYNDSWLLGK